MRAAENDFEGTRTTILWVRDATGQGGDWGAFVQVHTGRGQDTCISEQARRTRRTPTASGVDCVKTVGRARGSAHAQDADGQWSRQCEDGGSRKRCEDCGECWCRRNEQSDWALLLRRRCSHAGRRRSVESTV